MIEVEDISKRYGSTVAVESLTFTVKPGAVTGFLGPNGAGKSTTMRIVLGLDRPDRGSARVNGRAMHEHKAPLGEIGAVLDVKAAHPGRSAYDHLRALAATNGIGRRRVSDVLELVGLSAVARRRVGGFSLGMAQRLGLAGALLGDPATVMLDEPVNGLDPEGIRWIRGLLHRLAAEGRAVLVSSHLIREIAEVAEHVVVIGRGRLLADRSIGDLTDAMPGRQILVRTPEASRLHEALLTLAAAGVSVTSGELEDELMIEGGDPEQIGEIAAAQGIPLYHLAARETSLEEVFLELTGGSAEFRAGTATGRAA